MKNFITISILFSAIFFLNGCVTSMALTNQLEPGMSTSQVKGILGNPNSTEFKGINGSGNILYTNHGKV